MSRLPAVRLGSLHREDPSFHEIEVDFQPSSGSKFGFAWPDGTSPDVQHSRHDLLPESNAGSTASGEEETDSTPTNYLSQEETTSAPQNTSRHSSRDLHSSPSPPIPRLSRAFSMPLTSQLGHWQHPVRTNSGSGSPSTPAGERPSPPNEQQFNEFSLELADSLQMAIQTLLQLSPPQLFDPAKEQFAACAVQIPTPSISALLTSMKNLNYLSANMRKFGPPSLSSNSSLESVVEASEEALPKDEFDVGELLQSVGDSLGGVAAEAEVDLVLHHGDAGIRHMGVKGDECGISYALSHIIHQVILTTRRRDTMEIGLSLTVQPSPASCPAGPAETAASGSSSSSRRSSMSSDDADSPVLDDEGPIVCTFDIAHKFVSWPVDSPSPNDPNGEPPPEGMREELLSSDSNTRPEPQFDTAILRRLLKHIGGTLRPSLQPKLFRNGRRCELSVTLERGPSLSDICERSHQADEISRQNIRLAREPTLEELTTFAETLRGNKVAFHASSQGSFAHHLTRYLTALGMDISHVPTDGVEEKDPAGNVPKARADSVYSNGGPPSGLGVGLPTGDAIPPIIDSGSDVGDDSKSTSGEAGLSFIIIDDDVSVLRRRLSQHRVDVMPNLHLHPRKRPSLATNHRPRSSPSIRNTLLAAGITSPTPASSSIPIVHFTSLANYKLVKDAIQAALVTGLGALPVIPEVIVIPKPAGPRRLLTALHTAVNRPVVDPFFLPIATLPMSPSGIISPFFTGRKAASGATPPSASSRSGGERPTRSPRESALDAPGPLPPSSPLAIPEEYFTDASVKKLGGNAASGLVVQSPDGRPAGIFFQPQSRSSSSRGDVSMTAMERESGAPKPRSRRGSRRSSARKTNQLDPSDADASNNVTPKLGSLVVTSSLTLHGDKPSPSSPMSPWSERRSSGDQTAEFVRPFKGKGRTPSVSVEQEESRAAAWREATKSLAKLPHAPTSLNAEAAADAVVQQSPISGSVSMPPRKMSNPGVPLAMPRSSSSPTSPEGKKPARRSTAGPKSPVLSSGMKKSKTMGNNIVPPISVLIVEDNAINQTILSTFMRRNKIKYEVAWNGREAVEKWRSGNFHLILMDIQMPVMDGIEATKEIRRLEKLENISHFPPSPAESSRRFLESPDSRPSSAASTPFRSQVIIVALTASSLQSDRVAALAAGCNDFLTKPVTNSWLNDKVIEWGSIKALQMWAELRPEMAKNISHGQNIQALAVANKLHVPSSLSRRWPLGETPAAHLEEVARTDKEMAADDMQAQDLFAAEGTTAQHSSEKDGSDSDSSHDHWPLSSDDEAPQDPITEPPAVIQTPVRRTIDLPESEPGPEVEQEPHAVSGEAALLNFFEESKQDVTARPTILGRRALSSVSTSIASVMHDTPVVGAMGAALEPTASDSLGEDADPPSH